MTINEEIRKSIEPNAKTLYDETIIVDKVLKLFENLIDEKIRDVQSTFKSSQDTFLQHERRSSMIAILEQLKEELKEK
jgi:hypothetical protein